MEPNPYQSPTSNESPPSVEPEGQPTENGAVAFGVSIRVMGIASIVYGGWNMTGMVAFQVDPEFIRSDLLAALSNGCYYMLAGLALLGFAPLLTRLNYFVARNPRD